MGDYVRQSPDKKGGKVANVGPLVTGTSIRSQDFEDGESTNIKQLGSSEYSINDTDKPLALKVKST